MSFFGVYDGHGGKEVSAYVARHIVDIIKASDSFKNKQYTQCLIDAYLQLDIDMATEEGINELSQASIQGSFNFFTLFFHKHSAKP